MLAPAIHGSSLMNSPPANVRKRTRRFLIFFAMPRQGAPGREGASWGRLKVRESIAR
jgi:hypothetical protein